ncbi:hypothetical protein HF888_14375 [Bermanella marisrubri]|uniref:Outer membrane protein beta-barrel domain-containing protein n=1 Tax=Bermanella marisrubri TaxID=207949 RepID=Q1MY64_9GAMM|nr:hypothetical protein [Bermanella marisrubri]EAT10896.1 hypothetical protein RED65_12635 [Oceanobacter sp. RED65] [Bermanella marisrubri]QIZ85336.1 hypothetical protein HF888_14375 [Bermanella marisrubri]
MKFFPYVIFCIAFCVSSFSHSASQDVIYKKDGSVLRGELIEQDFSNGVYKIELIGGSVFVVNQADIEKITKEKAVADQSVSQGETEKELNSLADESRSKLQGRATTEKALLNHPAMPNVDAPSDKKIANVFYISTLAHTVSSDMDIYNGFYSETITFTETFTGLKLAFQNNLSKNVATHFSIRKGSLDSIEYTDEDDYVIQTVSSNSLPDVDYFGASVDMIVSTNHYQGFQLFSGLGISHDEYSSSFGGEQYTSLVLDLGLGYAWKPAQLALHYQGYIAGDYPDELDVANIHLQLGFHF